MVLLDSAHRGHFLVPQDRAYMISTLLLKQSVHYLATFLSHLSPGTDVKPPQFWAHLDGHTCMWHVPSNACAYKHPWKWKSSRLIVLWASSIVGWTHLWVFFLLRIEKVILCTSQTNKYVYGKDTLLSKFRAGGVWCNGDQPWNPFFLTRCFMLVRICLREWIITSSLAAGHSWIIKSEVKWEVINSSEICQKSILIITWH